jgi:hypothetical protein
LEGLTKYRYLPSGVQPGVVTDRSCSTKVVLPSARFRKPSWGRLMPTGERMKARVLPSGEREKVGYSIPFSASSVLRPVPSAFIV